MFAFCMGFGAHVFCQDFRFRTVGMNGMSDLFVRYITQDAEGYMWFATLYGINRYDGYTVKPYHLIHLGEKRNTVNWVEQDGGGTLWLKSSNGYYCYDREHDRMSSEVSERLRALGIGESADFLYIDKDKNLWCVSGKTLYHYDFAKHDVSSIALTGEGKPTAMACRGGRAFVITDQGTVYRTDLGSHSLTKELEVPALREKNAVLYLDSRMRLWLYVSHSPQVMIYDTAQRCLISAVGLTPAENHFITDIIDDGTGRMWIATDNEGVFCYEVGTGIVDEQIRKTDQPFSLPNDHVRCLYWGKDNVLWIGTTKMGVAYGRLGNQIFKTHRMPIIADVKDFMTDGQGRFWMCLDGQGLLRAEGEPPTYAIYSKKRGNSPSDIFICSHERRDGTLLFGTYGNGILTLRGNALVRWPVTENVAAIKYVNGIDEDEEGNLWVSTYINGVFCISGKGEISTYNMQNSALMTNSINRIWCKGERFLYIATGYGIYKVDTRSRRIESLRISSGDEAGAAGACCLYKDSRNRLWLGTREGAYVYDEDSGKLTRLTKDNGLFDDYVIGICEDRQHRVWLMGNNGITRVELSKGQYVCSSFLPGRGNGSTVFNQNAITCMENGDILMGTPDGYISMSPERIVPAGRGRTVRFTGIQQHDQYANITTDRLVLAHHENSFAIDLSCMNYGDENLTRFVYRLGRHGQWIKLDGNRITFAQLPPGSYSLYVKTAEANDKDASQLTIVVSQPWWWSWAARCAYLLIIALAVYAYIKRLKRKAARRMEYQRREMENRQQAEMNEAKMNFFTNVSHDLRTPLSLILIPVERLLSMVLPEEVESQVRLIGKSSNILMNEVNQLLDFKKLDEHQARMNATTDNLSAFVSDICNAFAPEAEQNGLRMLTSIGDSPIRMAFDHSKMQRVVLNLLSNAVKYNVKGGTVEVRLRTVEKDGKQCAELIVSDTGIGIKDENKRRIFQKFFQEQHDTMYVGNGLGLHIAHEYVAMHNGSIDVSDNQPPGTTFRVLLPIEGGAEQQAVVVADNASGKQSASGVLIVEDNHDLRRYLKDCLREHYRTYDAENGEDALKILHAEDIQIVVSDVMMPKMDGMQLLQQIKTNAVLSHIPVILLTAKVAEESVIAGLKEGADDYIPKPFNLEILKLRIDRILQWSAANHEKFRTIDISPKEITVSSLDEKLIAKAIAAVEQNMDNSEFSVEDLSAAVGMSRGHLYKKLMSITGKAPLEFIRILRLKRGKQLLEQSGENISQIAWRIGLSPKQFSKYFKEEYGCLPSAYNKPASPVRGKDAKM